MPSGPPGHACSCARLYRRAEFDGVRQYIDALLAICAGFTTGAKTLPCAGDSGGWRLHPGVAGFGQQVMSFFFLSLN